MPTSETVNWRSATNMGFKRSPPPFLAVANKTNKQVFRGELHHPAEPAGRAVRHRAAQHLGVSTGGNYLFAFFARNSTPSDADKRRFVGNLVSLYQNHVKALYVLGARKFAVIDVPPIGCCPYPRSLHPLGACIDVLNELARGFNKGVRDAMRGLGSNFQALKYSVRSSHAVVQSIMKHPQRLGFKDTTNACCGSGRFNGKSWRTPNATLCGNRHEYLFWDLLHPTHAASKVAAAAIYNGSLHFAAPVNFRQLVEDQC
ncbi:GDSL esterase/lipase [Panicum miliaceum]|uniref:GDSL esterase/lipase n=1 Tax=Panicum miliaceum TaxID=4540 RepID=A0A3L6QEJ2_PANMI|nr:GDSL esterase/lipase [Panicum miliaceum]